MRFFTKTALSLAATSLLVAAFGFSGGRDASAEKMLQESISAMKSLGKFKCESELAISLGKTKISNAFTAEVWRDKGFNLVTDGRRAPTRKSGPASVNQFSNNPMLCLLVTCDLYSITEGEPPVKPVVTKLPDEVWNDKTYKVLLYAIGGGFPESYKFYIGDDKIIYRCTHNAENMGRPYTYDGTITKLEKNPEFAEADFAVSASSRGEAPPMAPIPAGEFNLLMPDGMRLSLKDAMKGHKALLLNFWFINCPPCRSEHPHLNKLYNELKNKGLGVLAVDDQNKAEDVAAYMKNAKLDFPTVLSGARSSDDYKQLASYDVHSCPTNFLINCETGMITFRAGGWNEAAVRARLAELGVK